jgi:hypothetical protein
MSVTPQRGRRAGELEVHPLVDLRYGHADRAGGPVAVGPRRCPIARPQDGCAFGVGQAPPAVTTMSVTKPTARPTRTPA